MLLISYWWGGRDVFMRYARPPDAKDVGLHFLKCRAAFKQYLGHDLKLRIVANTRSWRRAKVQIMMTVAGNNFKKLLEWLETDQVIDTSLLSRTSKEALTNDVRDLYAIAQKKSNVTKKTSEYAGRGTQLM